MTYAQQAQGQLEARAAGGYLTTLLEGRKPPPKTHEEHITVTGRHYQRLIRDCHGLAKFHGYSTYMFESSGWRHREYFFRGTRKNLDYLVALIEHNIPDSTE